MKISISRIDPSLPMPEYHTRGAVAFDFYARNETLVPGLAVAKIPSNFIITTPPGYALIIASRSSLFSKKGLVLTNGIGIIDNDFCGPEDEILLSVYNMNKSDVIIQKGERIAQGMFVATARAEWSEDKNKSEESALSRGGFGSTG